MRRLAFLIAVLVTANLATAAPQQEKPAPPPLQRVTTHSSRSIGDDHTEIAFFQELAGVVRNPDATEQQRLRVRWEKASLGYRDLESDTWKVSDERRVNSMLAIHGTLLIESEDGKSQQPIDWVQGVRMVVARASESRPDWSKRHATRDSAWSDGVVQAAGKFLVRLNPDEIHRVVGRTERFQVALCLGIRTGQNIIWKNSVPVLPQSVALLPIPGPPRLSPIQQAVNGAPSVHDLYFNPAMLIRAVNRLHALGKERAIAELREFLKIARQTFMVHRHPENIDTSDSQCVLLIVRLLFEPAQPTEKLPWMNIGGMVPSPREVDLPLWPLFPLALQDELPLILITGVSLRGFAQQPSKHVDWAEKHGKLRAKPLRPLDDPLRAAEALLAKPQTQRLLGARADDIIRHQAWRSVAHLLKGAPGNTRVDPGGEHETKPDWEAYKRLVSQRKPRWDEREQAYVAD